VLKNRIKEFKEVELFLNDSFTVDISKPYYLHIDGEMEAKTVKEFTVSVAKEKIPFLIQ